MNNSNITRNKAYINKIGVFNNKEHDDKHNARKQQRAFERRVRIQAGRTYGLDGNNSGISWVTVGVISALALSGMIRVIEGSTTKLNSRVNSNGNPLLTLEPTNKTSSISERPVTTPRGMYTNNAPSVIIKSETELKIDHAKINRVKNDFVGQAIDKLSDRATLKNNYSRNNRYSKSPYLSSDIVQKSIHFFNSGTDKELSVVLEFANIKLIDRFINRVFFDNNEDKEIRAETGKEDPVTHRELNITSGKILNEIDSKNCHIVEFSLKKEGFTRLFGAVLLKTKELTSLTIDQSQFDEYEKNLNDTVEAKKIAKLFSFKDENQNCRVLKKGAIKLSGSIDNDQLMLDEVECTAKPSISEHSRSGKPSNGGMLSPELQYNLQQSRGTRCVKQVVIVGDGIEPESSANSTITTTILPQAEMGNFTFNMGSIPLSGKVEYAATQVAMRIKKLCPDVRFHDIRLPGTKGLTPLTLAQLIRVCDCALSNIVDNYHAESLVILEIDPIPYYSPVTKAVGCLLSSLRRQGLTPFSLYTDPLSWLAGIPQIHHTESVADIALRETEKEHGYTALIAGFGALIIGSIIFFPTLGVALYLKRNKKQNKDIEIESADIHELRPLNFTLSEHNEENKDNSFEFRPIRSELSENLQEREFPKTEEHSPQEDDHMPENFPPKPPLEPSSWVTYSEMSPGTQRRIKKLAITNPIQNIYSHQKQRENQE